MPCNVLGNFSNLRKLLFFCLYLGVSNTPHLGGDVMIMHLFLVVTVGCGP